MPVDADRQILAQEIYSAARRGLARAFLDPQDETRLRTLKVEVARIRPRDIRMAPTTALIVILDAAVRRLPEESTPPGTNLTWQEFAALTLGLPPDHSSLGSYDERCAIGLTKWHKGAERSIRTARTQLWLQLADTLIQMRPQQALPDDTTKWSGEVARPEIQRKIRWAIDDGECLINLWGDSGNGKTYAARQYMRDNFGSARSAVIRRGKADEPIYQQDLIKAAIKCGHRPESWTIAALEISLQDEIRAGAHLDVVLFDDVSEGVMTWLLDSGRPQIPVLLTSPADTSAFTNVHVAEYTPEEAVAAAQLALPGQSLRSIQTLCERLAYRPAVLDIAFKLISNESLEPAVLIEAIGTNRLDAVRDFELMNGRYVAPYHQLRLESFQTLYREVIRVLHQIPDSEPALRLLDTILWITGVGSITQIVALTFQLPDDAEAVTVKAALRTLEAMAIIKIDEGFISINDLTLEALRRESIDRMPLAIESHIVGCLDTQGFRAVIDRVQSGGNLTLNFAYATAEEFRNSAGVSLACTWLALQNIVGSADRGCHIVNGQMLYWNIADEDRADYYLRVSSMDAVYLWEGASARREEDFGESRDDGALYVICLAANSAFGEPWGASRPKFEWFTGTPTDAVWHRQHSAMTDSFADVVGLSRWTACGRRIEQLSMEPLPRCPECEPSRATVENMDLALIVVEYLRPFFRSEDNWREQMQLENCLIALNPAAALKILPQFAATPSVRHDIATNSLAALADVEILFGLLVRAIVCPGVAFTAEQIIEALLVGAAYDAPKDSNEFSLQIHILAGIEAICRAYGRTDIADSYSERVKSWIATQQPQLVKEAAAKGILEVPVPEFDHLTWFARDGRHVRIGVQPRRKFNGPVVNLKDES